MSRFQRVSALIIGLFMAWPSLAQAKEEPVATLISFEGNVQVGLAGNLKPAELGQWLAAGDHIVTAEDSGAHLVLADGSSLVLGTNSNVKLKALGDGHPGSRTFLELTQGVANIMAQTQSPGSLFNVETGNATAAVKGADFELAFEPGDTQVTVNEGLVDLSDPTHKRTVQVHPLEQAQLFGGRLNSPNALSKRDIDDFRGRWERAHLIHQQRFELLKTFKAQEKTERKKLKARQALARAKRLP
jgi:FecR protein